MEVVRLRNACVMARQGVLDSGYCLGWKPQSEVEPRNGAENTKVWRGGGPEPEGCRGRRALEVTGAWRRAGRLGWSCAEAKSM